MIEGFIGGIFNVVLFIISDIWRVVAILFVVLLIAIVAIFPGAIYVYPIWSGTPPVVDLHLFEGASDVDILLSTPTRVLPGRLYTIQIQLTASATVADDVMVNLKINRNKPYLNFTDQNSLPIVEQRRIPPGSTAIVSLPFTISETGQPREPVSLTLEIETGNKKMQAGYDLAIDFITVPVLALAGIGVPLALALLRTIWFIIFKS